jgi:hypothetical protein
VKPVAIFYHCIFTGTERVINSGFVMDLMAQQMQTLEAVGLADYAREMYVGVNGGEDDAEIARMLAPNKAKIIAHGKGTGTEITTLNFIREWVKSRSGWYVLYFHTKGVSHPENPNTTWRLNMERHVLHNWRTCILDLDKGYDCCGSYWLTPEEHRSWVKSPFFGGTFWWAKADYLATLSPLPAPEFINRYDAEGWIGSGPRRPRIMNYISGWPPQQ